MSGQLSLENEESKPGWWKLGRGRSKLQSEARNGGGKKKGGLSALTRSRNKVKGENPGPRQ